MPALGNEHYDGPALPFLLRHGPQLVHIPGVRWLGGEIATTATILVTSFVAISVIPVRGGTPDEKQHQSHRDTTPELSPRGTPFVFTPHVTASSVES